MKLLNRILSLLPFDGDKTKLGAIGTVIALIKTLFPDVDLLALLDQHLLAIGISGFAGGLIHKLVKQLLEQAPEK